jgi:hypothetical protein
MATLNERATDRRISYVKYVKENKNWKQLDLKIERGKSNVPVYDEKGNISRVLKQGDSIGDLRDNKLYRVQNVVKKPTYDNGYFLRTKLGYVSIFMIRKPTNKDGGLSYERDAINKINESISFPVNLVVKGKTKQRIIENVMKAENVRGTPKADFKIVSPRSRPKSFISHKAGKAPTDFQQYGGLTEQKIARHKEVMAFIEAVYQITKGMAAPGQAFWAPIKSRDLIRLSVFGVDYGKPFGENNCDFLAQGIPRLKPHPNKEDYYLKWDGKTLLQGEEQYLKGGYEPIFLARYSVGRQIRGVKRTIKNLRAGIFPYAAVRQRKAVKVDI